MPPRVVKDFEFSPDFGFTGSAGKQTVRGYMRGGPVAPAKNPKQLAAIALSAARKTTGGIPEPKPHAPSVKVAGAPAKKAMPAFNAEPMVPGMRKGGKVGC